MEIGHMLELFCAAYGRSVKLGGNTVEVFEGAQLAQYLLESDSDISGDTLLQDGLIVGVPVTGKFTANAYWYALHHIAPTPLTTLDTNDNVENVPAQRFPHASDPSDQQLADVYNRMAKMGGLTEVKAEDFFRSGVQASLSQVYHSIIQVESLLGSAPTADHASPRVDTELGEAFDPFSHPICETMSWQRSGNGDPKLKMPTVVFFLAHAVLSGGGFQLEGLFRKSPKDSDKRAWKEAIVSGQYSSLLDFTATDAHLPAVLMKQYFLELPEALIGDYTAAINAAHSAEDCLHLVARLPKDNFNTLKFLVEFLRIVSSHSSVTKMDLNNLCIVFSPCILHATEMATLDMQRYRESLANEQKFLRHLMDRLPGFPLGVAAVGRRVKLKADGQVGRILEATTELKFRVGTSEGERVVDALQDIQEFLPDGSFDAIGYLGNKFNL